MLSTAQSIKEDAAPALKINTEAPLPILPQQGEPAPAAMLKHTTLHDAASPFSLSTSGLLGSAQCSGALSGLFGSTSLCGQSRGSKNGLRADADRDNQDRDGARTDREHG